jgi:hypothetical protein
MKVWTCNDFKGFWPVGTAAVVCAEDEEDARVYLDAILRDAGLDGLDRSDYVVEFPMNEGEVRILCDGNY